VASRFFFERWLESRGLSFDSLDPEELSKVAEQSLKDLQDYKLESDSYGE
jgi:hypothetical protein